eukprot:m.70837 g.70837  ORF g.70837 m.70837 type:complete len:187 (-) comp24276_c2_seq1:415-975(-)
MMSPSCTTGCVEMRRYNQLTDAAAVRNIWEQGLLGNTRAPQLAYPQSLIEEEVAFVSHTLANGDMVDLEQAYQLNQRTGFWVAVVDSQVVGMVGLRFAAENANSGDIGRLGVHSDFRKRGIAKSLLTILENHALYHKFVSITAITTALNLPALQTYRSLGFIETFRGRRDGHPTKPHFVTLRKIIR